MAISDADGVVTKVNRALCEMSGFRPRTRGHRADDFCHPEDMMPSFHWPRGSSRRREYRRAEKVLEKERRYSLDRDDRRWNREPRGHGALWPGNHPGHYRTQAAEEALERGTAVALENAPGQRSTTRQIISYEIHDGLTQYLAAATMQFPGA